MMNFSPGDTQAPRRLPEGEMGGINVILLTIRFDETVRAIVDACLCAGREHAALRLTIADGSLDPAKASWLDARIAASGADVVLIRDPDVGSRVKASLDPKRSWTLFAADDDPFTVNYLSAFVTKAQQVGPNVALIAPSLYIGHGGGQLIPRPARRFSGACLKERLAQFHAQPLLPPVAFYSLIRTGTVTEWAAHFQRKGFFPSYSDQVLATLAVARGDFEVVDGLSALVRDETVWLGGEQSIKANARYYPRPDMVLFHEVFWIADMVELLSAMDGFEQACPTLRQWAVNLLPVLARELGQRVRLVGMSASHDYAQLLEGCGLIQRWLEQTRDPAELLRGFRYVTAFAADVRAAIMSPVPSTPPLDSVASGTAQPA